jgi:hypothetical protein
LIERWNAADKFVKSIGRKIDLGVLPQTEAPFSAGNRIPAKQPFSL